jgi:alpha-L-rhamnosidase
MNYSARFIFFFIGLTSALTQAQGQDVYGEHRQQWLAKAEALKPKLSETIKHPRGLVTLLKDEAAFQGWKSSPGLSIDSLYLKSFKKQSGVVVDFGEHLTGHFSCSLKILRGTSDAPLRFRFTFGEVPAEFATPFDPYPGTLSRAWLQDEVVTVMDVPTTITFSRRFSFRYVKIELLGSSPYFDFTISDLVFNATTSVTTTPPPLVAHTNSEIVNIDKVGLNTLKECMQTVYEDGPKRDQRLWIGDLYLESLANTYSFKNHSLTKRCLYLLAGLSKEDGALNANVFETPEPHPQVGAPFLFDYSLLYNVAVKEYLTATNDKETALDLWPLIKKQMDNPKKYLGSDGMFRYDEAEKARWWLFVDWSPTLDKEASIQGIIIYSMKQTYALAKVLGKENEVAELPDLIKKMTAAARRKLYNVKSKLFESGPAKQVSYASQAWMVLSGVANNQEGKAAISALLNSKEAVHPGGPYLYHYYIEAMIQTGMFKEARETLTDYWGSMVKKGADTFWEVYDPTNEFLSPYNFSPVNSYCHAWSCTPVYFIRKYPEIFQN